MLLRNDRSPSSGIGGHVGPEYAVKHKKVFFDAPHANYNACLEGGFRFVPEGELATALEDDYGRMIEAGMFYEAPPAFDDLIHQLHELEKRINR
jgi:hypothetical protein